MSYTVGPKLGDARAGWAAGRWGATGALWTGGLGAAVGIAALAVALPSVIAYDSRTDRHAAAVRFQRDAELSPSSATTDPVDSAVCPSPCGILWPEPPLLVERLPGPQDAGP
ncbi:hypothetical protein ABT072_44185 [Streptomyces sp. NPDC002589]|uniref:hypothetical protein n=1 Tax=Streptomyces sp. NPDC002589 TaxID=3154420 RepID=UPI003320C8D6